MKLLLPTLMLLLLGACTTQPPAPVSDRTIGIGPYGSSSGGSPAPAPSTVAQPGFYTVKKGDTLYSISLDHGQSYRDIAVWNNLDQYYTIKPGQVLRVTPEDQAGTAVVKPVQSGENVEIRPVSSSTAPAVASTPAAPSIAPSLKTEPKGGKIAYSDAAWAAEQQRPATAPTAAAPAPAPAPAAAPKPAEQVSPAPAAAAPPAGEDSDWVWPTSGTVGTTFADSNKGIDIPAKPGQPVVAANSGTVTLVSNALRGYGNLLVIKHSQTLLSVYAHNSKILVSEGQSVTKGQKVAEAGNTDSDITKLHFEIRSMGKPVDPLKYLPPR